MLTRKQCKSLAEKVLDLSKADEVSLSLSEDETTHLRYARNAPTTSGTNVVPRLAVTSSFGARSGRATVNQFDEEGLTDAVRRSEAAARLAPEDPEHMPLLGPQSYPTVDAYDEPSSSRGHEHMVDGVATCISAAEKAELVAAGYTETRASMRCVANSAGLFAYHTETGTYLSETARTKDGGGSGWASSAGHRLGDIDYAGVSSAAIRKAERSVEPVALEPGSYPTILEPACVASMVGLLLGAMDARRADEGRSFFAGADGGTRLGETLFPESIDIASDPSDPRAPVRPWAGSGLPRREQSWIDRGRVAGLATSRYWAEKTGQAPLPRHGNVLMAGGASSLEELISGLDRGLLVTSLWYIRSVDPQSLLFTGLTRDGVFWIENGAIVRPVKNFRWNESPVAVLKKVRAMSAPERVPPRGSRANSYVVPALAVDEFTFSSVSDAV